MSVRLKRATYRHIEAEIYAYHDTLKAIDELRDEIILASRQEELGVAVSGGDYSASEVERRTTKLADSYRSGFVFGIRRCWQGNLFLQKIWDYFSTAGQLDTE
jgi:hypothetical protein